MDDGSLSARVAQAQLGDARALDEILCNIQEPVLRHIRAIVEDEDHAWDVVQVTLLSIARSLKSLRDPGLFRPWAFRIATRAAVKAVKRERRESIRSDLPIEAATEIDEPDYRWDEVSSQIDNLPLGARIVVQMHYIDGIKLWEIAEALEISLGTVKSRLNYGLSLLREKNRAEIRPSFARE